MGDESRGASRRRRTRHIRSLVNPIQEIRSRLRRTGGQRFVLTNEYKTYPDFGVFAANKQRSN